MFHSHQSKPSLLFDHLRILKQSYDQPHQLLLPFHNHPFSEVRCQPIEIMLEPIRTEDRHTAHLQSTFQLMHHREYAISCVRAPSCITGMIFVFASHTVQTQTAYSFSFTFAHHSSNCICARVRSLKKRSCNFRLCAPLRISHVRRVLSWIPSASCNAEVSIPSTSKLIDMKMIFDKVFSRYNKLCLRIVNFVSHA